jgi:hypothetical protein
MNVDGLTDGDEPADVASSAAVSTNGTSISSSNVKCSSFQSTAPDLTGGEACSSVSVDEELSITYT